MKEFSIMLALLIAAAIPSCTQKGSTSEDHPHDENLQITAYSEDFEVFAEATPFVTGQSSEILTHFSFLKNFKPLESGSVTASLIVGTEGVRQTLEQPTRAGIYLFILKPEKEGIGKIVFDVETADGTSQITVPNIKVYSYVHDAQHDAADAVATSINGVMFTKEQSWKVDFATEEVLKENFGQIVNTIGQIQPSLDDERVIPAKTSGMVLFTGNNLVEGNAVRAGQTLFTIDASELADNNLSVRFSEAQSEYKRAKAEYERKADLAKENIVSQSELLKAETDFSTAEANYSNLRRNFNLGKQSVSSPINGYVANLLVRNGQFAEAGQPVLVVSQNQNLFIKAELRPKHFSILKNIKSAIFRIVETNQTYTLEELDGKLVSYGKTTDVNNPLIPVVFQINNKVGFLSGTFVDIYIQTQTNDEAITVANEAIVEEMGNYFVYVQYTPEYFEKRLVMKGETDGIRTEIIEGISVGERIVSKGAILIKLAQYAGAVDAHSGHVH